MTLSSSTAAQDQVNIESTNSLLIRYRLENDRLRERIKELAERLNVVEQVTEGKKLNNAEQKIGNEFTTNQHAEYLYRTNREAIYPIKEESLSQQTLSTRSLPCEQVNSTNSIVGVSDFHNTFNCNSTLITRDNEQTNLKIIKQCNSPENNKCVNVHREQKNILSKRKQNANEHELKGNTEIKEIVSMILRLLNISEYLVKVFNAVSHCLTEPHDYIKCQVNLLNCIQRCLRAAKRGKSCLQRSDLNVSNNSFNKKLIQENNNDKLEFINSSVDVHFLRYLVESLEEELSYCEMVSKNTAREMLLNLRETLKISDRINVENKFETWKSIIKIFSEVITLSEQEECLHARQTELYKNSIKNDDVTISNETVSEDNENESFVITRVATESKLVSTPHLDEGDCEMQ